MAETPDNPETDASQDAQSDRRVGQRHLACFPARIEVEGETPQLALTRDLSVSGALILAQQRFAVGDNLSLSLFMLLKCF